MSGGMAAIKVFLPVDGGQRTEGSGKRIDFDIHEVSRPFAHDGFEKLLHFDSHRQDGGDFRRQNSHGALHMLLGSTTGIFRSKPHQLFIDAKQVTHGSSPRRR
jgi:hypothetical protein